MEDPEITIKRNQLMISLLLDSIFFVLVISMTLSNRDAAMQCATPMYWWLLVFCGILAARMLKNLIAGIVITLSNNPLRAEAKLDIVYCCTILNFEFAWLIFGNSFNYSQAGMACFNLSSSSRDLWILMTVILSYGYLVFLLYGVIAISTIYVLTMTYLHQR